MKRPATNPATNAEAADVRPLLDDLGALFLKWSWEGVAGYGETVKRVAATNSCADTCLVMEASCIDLT